MFRRSQARIVARIISGHAVQSTARPAGRFSRCLTTTTGTESPPCSPSSLDQVFLHVGPSGDCFTGSAMYAAKHLQPDYVKSIPLPGQISAEALLEKLEDDQVLAQKVYDDGCLPEEMLLELVKKADE